MRSSIRAARKLMPPVSFGQLRETNLSLQTKRAKKAPHSQTESKAAAGSVLERIRQLHKKMDSKIEHPSTAKTRANSSADSTLQHARQVLNAFTHHAKAQAVPVPAKPSQDKLVQVFQKLCEIKVNTDLFKACKLMKLLKVFIRESFQSGNKDLAGLAKVADLLVVHWSKICLLEENDPPCDKDSASRRVARKRIAEILIDKGLPRDKSQRLAAASEQSLLVQPAASYKFALATFVSQLAEASPNQVEPLVSKLVKRG